MYIIEEVIPMEYDSDGWGSSPSSHYWFREPCPNEICE